MSFSLPEFSSVRTIFFTRLLQVVHGDLHVTSLFFAASRSKSPSHSFCLVDRKSSRLGNGIRRHPDTALRHVPVSAWPGQIWLRDQMLQEETSAIM